MRYELTVKSIALIVTMLVATQISGYRTSAKCTFIGEGNEVHAQAQDDWNEREEIHQSYKLSAGASVEVSMIYGPVDIETIEGNTAEVHIVRTARRRQDLDTRRINIENAPASLAIRGERDMSQEEARVRHRVLLKLPRRVELTVERVNARLNVGEIDGGVRISRINGAVKIGRAAGQAEIAHVNGSLDIKLSQVGKEGIRISQVNGGVDLRFTNDLDADLSVIEFNGSVNADMPKVDILEKLENKFFRARIGSGDIPISISNVNGSIRLSPAN